MAYTRVYSALKGLTLRDVNDRTPYLSLLVESPGTPD